jgi:two-component system, cell cycle sensor histidine kinase and response regulator CckA
VIEDEGPVRQVARLLLENRGYTVIEADGGEQALQLTESRGEPIHLLLTDVVMPGLNGPEIASQLLERFPNLKVVYMSGFTDDMVFRHGVISEGVNFLQKPFTPASLTQKIREILDGSAKTETETDR